MKKYMMVYAIAALCIVLLVTSCKKVYDYIDTHPNADINICPIKEFAFSAPYNNFIDTLTFKYNIWGNPVSITRPDPRTGAPDYEFRYDKNGRLTDFIGLYSNGIWTELWHRYFYDGMGRINKDSVYVWANIINGQMSNPYDSYESLINYDSKNRVSQETRIWDGHTDVFTYTYDAQGNKTGSIYDQKINFHRTNKIWMFIDRDYSMNNPFNAISYNSFGLPTKIGQSSTFSNGSFLTNYFTGVTIKYMCDNQKVTYAP